MQLLMYLWQQISLLITDGKEYIAAIGVLAGVVAALLAWIRRPPGELTPEVQRATFTFDRLIVDELFDPTVLQQKLILADADIRYVDRLPVDQQQQMRDEWRNILGRSKWPRLLVQGVPGLGKTREMNAPRSLLRGAFIRRKAARSRQSAEVSG